MKIRIFFPCLALFLFVSSAASEESCPVNQSCIKPKPDDSLLTSHEPITVGYTKDSDDVPFMDFRLSLRYRLAKDTVKAVLDWSGLDGDNNALFFAFSGRFGQYIGTRDSSPVIAKRFNPNFFARHWTDKKNDAYIDFTFIGHESNGQSINTLQQYQQAQNSAERAEFANDSLSRGWDYLEVVRKDVYVSDTEPSDFTTYLKLKYFLRHGLLQGSPEEYNSWENNPEGKSRNRVNGIGGIVKYRLCRCWNDYFSDLKIAGAFETGYREAFRYNTYRGAIGVKIFEVPITLWVQAGYGSDLAQYYKKVSSLGIQVEIGSF